jgi:hypothetical protein
MSFVRALALTAVLSMPVAALADECGLKQIASLHFVTGQDGTILIPVTIQDQPEYLMMVTDTEHSALIDRVAEELKLPSERLPPGYSINYMKMPVSATVTLPSLKLDKVSASAVQVLKIPALDGYDPRLAGVLGLDILENFDVEIDFRSQVINLFAHDHCPGQVVYWTHAPYAALPILKGALGNFTVPMTLDGTQVNVSPDTSYAQSSMRMVDAHALFGLDDNSPGYTPVEPPPPGMDLARRYKFKSISADGIAVGNPSVIVLHHYDPDTKRCKGMASNSLRRTNCYGQEADIELGTDVLRKLHLFFAFGEQKLYLTAADAPPVSK